MICSCAHVFKFLYTPPDGASTEYQISNREFSDFLRTYFVIFCTTCIAREVFSLVIMENDKQVLPVLHWLEVVIAFVSSLFIHTVGLYPIALLLFVSATFTRGQRLRIRYQIRRVSNLPIRKLILACYQVRFRRSFTAVFTALFYWTWLTIKLSKTSNFKMLTNF